MILIADYSYSGKYSKRLILRGFLLSFTALIFRGLKLHFETGKGFKIGLEYLHFEWR